MEQHPVLGANLLLRYPDFARGVAIVRHHHERIDGRGYPDGLAGNAIPFGARVIARGLHGEENGVCAAAGHSACRASW